MELLCWLLRCAIRRNILASQRVERAARKKKLHWLSFEAQADLVAGSLIPFTAMSTSRSTLRLLLHNQHASLQRPAHLIWGMHTGAVGMHLGFSLFFFSAASDLGGCALWLNPVMLCMRKVQTNWSPHCWLLVLTGSEKEKERIQARNAKA